MQEIGCDIEDIFVIGLGLPKDCRALMNEALPHCILYNPTLENRGATSWLCARLGKVVVFVYIPTMLAHMRLRTSAVFNQQNVKVVGLHPACDDSVRDAALSMEFAGLMSSDSAPDALRDAVASVHRGELWYPRLYLSNRLRTALSHSSPGSLSQRETEILDLLANGETNQAIADKLCLSRGTVRWHLRSIYGKLGVSDREAAFRLAKNQPAPPANPPDSN